MSFNFFEKKVEVWLFKKKSQVFGNFLTVKWQFSGGSDSEPNVPSGCYIYLLRHWNKRDDQSRVARVALEGSTSLCRRHCVLVCSTEARCPLAHYTVGASRQNKHTECCSPSGCGPFVLPELTSVTCYILTSHH